MTDTLASAARGSGFTFLGALVSAISGFGLSIVLARSLGSQGSGIVFQLMSIFTITGAVARLGLDTTAVWILPRLMPNSLDVRRAARVIMFGSLAGGILAGAVLLALAPLLGGSSQDLQHLTRIAALFMPFATVATVGIAVSRGLGGVRDFVVIGSIVLPVGRLAAVSVAAAFAATAIVLGTVWLGVCLIAALLALLAVRRVLPAKDGTASTVAFRPLIQRVGSFSAPRTLSSGIEQALVWVDVLIVGIIAGPAAAGVYGVVSRLVQAGKIPSTSVRIVVAPVFSRMLHDERIEELSEFYTRTAQWIVLFSIPLYVTLIVFRRSVLAIFGAEFVTGAPALVIMCLGAIVAACTGNVQSMLLMSGRSAWVALNKVVVLAISLTLLITLVPPLGVIGGAIAFTAATSIDALLAWIQVRIGVGVHQGFGPVLLAIVSAGLAAAIPLMVVRVIFGETMTGLVIGALAAAGCWLGLIVVVRHRFALDEVTRLASARR